MQKTNEKLDKIALSGMKFYGYHGCLNEEREQGQDFYVDVTLSLSLHSAGKSDELKNTVNYAAVSEIVKSVVEGQRSTSSRPSPSISPTSSSAATRKCAPSKSPCTSRPPRSRATSRTRP